MKHSCFVIPCHPPKFAFLSKLLASYRKFFEDDDVLIVFSSKEERNLFRRTYADLTPRSVIHCPASQRKNIVTEKKFHGLRAAFDLGYKYAGVIDAECLFLRHLDYDAYFRKWFARRTFYGTQQMVSHRKFMHKLVTRPKRFFPFEDQARLTAATRDDSLYCWFNNVPIYECESFLTLFEWFTYDALHFEDFDNTIYMYHLILNYHFNIEEITSNGRPVHTVFGFMENQRKLLLHMPLCEFAAILHKIRPLWCTDPDESFNPEIMLRFHLDRTHI